MCPDSHKDQTDSGTMSGKKHGERDPVSGEWVDSIIVSGHLYLCVQFVSWTKQSTVKSRQNKKMKQ